MKKYFWIGFVFAFLAFMAGTFYLACQPPNFPLQYQEREED